MVKKRAFRYTRVSTKELQEDKNTQQVQVDLIDDYAQAFDYEIIDSFFDSSSGKDLDRDDLQDMLMRLNEVDYILVRDQSRLTREVKDLVILKEIFNAEKVEVIGVIVPMDWVSDEGNLFAEIKASFDKYERLKTKQRTKEGIAQFKKTHGRWGRLPKIKDTRFDYWHDEKGITNKTVLAQILGVSRPTIYNYMKRRGIK
jgi:DNA invertase Pin-like site-specific DNA recombinase